MKKIRLLVFDQNSLEIQVPILFPSHINYFILKIGDKKSIPQLNDESPTVECFVFILLYEGTSSLSM